MRYGYTVDPILRHSFDYLDSHARNDTNFYQGTAHEELGPAAMPLFQVIAWTLVAVLLLCLTIDALLSRSALSEWWLLCRSYHQLISLYIESLYFSGSMVASM